MPIVCDEKNAEDHWYEHHIRFEQAQRVFLDPNIITEVDDRFDYGETRYWTLGMVEDRHLLLYVAHTVEENGELVIRIISARKAKPHERRRYSSSTFYRRTAMPGFACKPWPLIVRRRALPAVSGQ